MYKDAFCEMDQGGPIILQNGAKSSGKPGSAMLQVMRAKVIPRRITTKNRNSRTTAQQV